MHPKSLMQMQWLNIHNNKDTELLLGDRWHDELTVEISWTMYLWKKITGKERFEKYLH